jgi:hypothetical protein
VRICNNKDGFPDCCGSCYKDGLCISKCKCEDSLTVNEELIKQLMSESGRHERMISKFKQVSENMRGL